MKTNNKGFSLVELIVVIAIMAILAAVAIPTFATFINKANEAADADFLAQAKYAIELANAGTADFEVESVSVTVDGKGEFDQIAYSNGTTDITIPSEFEEDDTSDEEIKDASAAIDWGYAFKAYKSTTVIFEKNATTGEWEVSSN